MKIDLADSTKAKINKLAKKVKVKLNWDKDPRKSYMYDGKYINCKNQTASNIIHDIAHYALSSKTRRKIVEYGLGAGPETASINIDNANDVAINERVDNYFTNEEKASALGIYWEKKLKLNYKKTYNDHKWYEYNIEDAWKLIEKTIKKYDI